MAKNLIIGNSGTDINHIDVEGLKLYCFNIDYKELIQNNGSLYIKWLPPLGNYEGMLMYVSKTKISPIDFLSGAEAFPIDCLLEGFREDNFSGFAVPINELVDGVNESIVPEDRNYLVFMMLTDVTISNVMASTEGFIEWDNNALPPTYTLKQIRYLNPNSSNLIIGDSEDIVPNILNPIPIKLPVDVKIGDKFILSEAHSIVSYYRFELKDLNNEIIATKEDVYINENSCIIFTISKIPSGNIVKLSPTVHDTYGGIKWMFNKGTTPLPWENNGIEEIIIGEIRKAVSLSPVFKGEEKAWEKTEKGPNYGVLRGKVDPTMLNSGIFQLVIYDEDGKAIFLQSKDFIKPDSEGYFEFPLNTYILQAQFAGSPGLLEILEMPNTEKVLDMSTLVAGTDNLTTFIAGNNFDTSNVTTMKYMFYPCPKLKTVELGPNFDTSKVTDFSEMFSNAESLETLDLGDKFTTANAKANCMGSMFYFCPNLKTLHLGNNFDCKCQTNNQPVIDSCNSLTNVTGKILNIDFGLYLGGAQDLTPESCMVFINGLVDNPTNWPVIQFDRAAYGRLTPEQIAVATAKGWNVISN